MTTDVNKNSYLDLTLFWIDTDKPVWNLSHSSFSCKHFPERHTAANISCLIKEALRELTLEDETPCTTDKGANVVCALNFAARIDCACHRLNTVIESAWSEIQQCNSDLNDLDKFTKEQVRYVHQAAGIQARLPTTLKGGGLTRPWRSLAATYESLGHCYEKWREILHGRQKLSYITRIDIDLVNQIAAFLKPATKLFDKLEGANAPTLQFVLPSYYTLYEQFQPKPEDNEVLSLCKEKFLSNLNKLWQSITMIHFLATYMTPRFKSFKFVKSLPDRATFLDQTQSSLLTYFKGLPTSIFDSIDSNLKSASTAKKKQERGSDPFDWCTSDPNPAGVNSKCDVTETELLQEYTLYNAVNSFENESNPLTFWCSQRKKMPILAHIAATIFVMQASSTESERHYSAFNARHIITPIRNRLCPDVVEAVSINLESYKNSLL